MMFVMLTLSVYAHWASLKKYADRPERVAQLAEHWASIEKVVGSILNVAGHIFQAHPVWIYTQSNITNIIENMVKVEALSARIRAKEPKATKHQLAFGSYKKCCRTHYWGGHTPGGTSPTTLYIYSWSYSSKLAGIARSLNLQLELEN